MLITPELNKWYIGVSFYPDFVRMECGWRLFNFWFMKLSSFPEIGEELQNKHYKGFRIRFYIWIPFDSY